MVRGLGVAVGARTRVAVVACAVLLLASCGGLRGTSEPESSLEDGVRQVRLDKPKVIDVDGQKVATRCAGDRRDPAVLLVAGYDTAMADAWGDLQARVGAFARVCAYDRLGVGGSGKPPEAQTFAGMAETLDGVLSGLDLKRPVVLVAHSLGGMLAATWASGHPEEVRGLLLLDATGPGYPMRLLELLPRRGKSAGAQLRDGFEQLLEPSKNAERLDGGVSFAAVETLTPMGDVPMTVLTHSIIDPGDVLPETAAALESFWEEGQNRWLKLATQARLERVDRAGHFIQLDQPQVVTDRVQELVDD